MILTPPSYLPPSRIRLSNVSKSSVSVRKYESAAAKWKTEIRNVLAGIAIIKPRINSPLTDGNDDNASP